MVIIIQNWQRPAIYESARAVAADGNEKSADALRNELKNHYRETWHGRLVTQQD